MTNKRIRGTTKLACAIAGLALQALLPAHAVEFILKVTTDGGNTFLNAGVVGFDISDSDAETDGRYLPPQLTNLAASVTSLPGVVQPAYQFVGPYSYTSSTPGPCAPEVDGAVVATDTTTRLRGFCGRFESAISPSISLTLTYEDTCPDPPDSCKDINPDTGLPFEKTRWKRTFVLEGLNDLAGDPDIITGTYDVTITVPEPTTIAIFAIGLAATALTRKRRFRFRMGKQ